MGTLFDISKLFSTPELLRVEVKVVSYPDSVIVTEKDAANNNNPKAESLEDYFWRNLAAGRDFEGMDWIRNPEEIILLVKQDKSATENLKKVFEKVGIKIEVIATKTIQGKFGFYKF